MSVVPMRRRVRGAAGLAVGIAFVTLLVLSAIPAGTAPTPPAEVRALATPPPCPGALLPHNYTGTVATSADASLPNVTLRYAYASAETVERPDGDVLSTACVASNGTVRSAAAGAFAFSIDPVPTSNCSTVNRTSGWCLSITGPYSGVNVSALPPLPAGDFSTVDRNGTAFAVTLDPYLASVRIHPAPAIAMVSPNAVDAFSAEPLTGAGNVTPLATDLAWTLAGPGWSFVGPATGPAVNLTAAPGATFGNLSVLATVDAGGTTFSATAGEQLLAVPTAISSASLNRTAVDIGESVAAIAQGTAAAGYAYTATVDPGLGAPTVTARCASTPGAEGAVALTCPVDLSYAAAGVAQPTITVSNGLSSATWLFPPVTVAPAPSLTLDPAAPVGYVGAPIPIALVAAPGTGVAPYAEACLAPGAGVPECASSSGPSWSFAPVYLAPGAYSVTGWAIDGAGTNRSAATTVMVVAPPAVALATAAATANVGNPLALSATVTGGALPARVWWNVSGLASPLATGLLRTDGAIDATFVPVAAGFAIVTVTVVDGLGTAVSATENVTVTVDPATEAAPVGLPPAGPVRAGDAVGVAWQALDAEGNPVETFASAGTIELVDAATGGAARGAVNASGVGALASAGPGAFDVPAAAWLGGRLNVTVTVDLAGSISVELSVPAGLPSGAGSVGLTVLPDVDHLVLSEPRTVLAEARSNETLWQVADRFGNAAVGASIVIATSGDGATVRTTVPVLATAGGSTEVWVNYSLPGSAPASVEVTDLAGDPLLPTISVPGTPGPLLGFPALPVGVAALVGAAVGSGARLRARSRRPPPPPRVDPEADAEAELQRLAEGQATVVEIVGRSGPIDLAGVATLWTPPPAPPDLPDWIAALLTDGTLDATFGADGVARFVLPAPRPGAPSVTVDVGEFDQGQSRRDALRAERDRDER